VIRRFNAIALGTLMAIALSGSVPTAAVTSGPRPSETIQRATSYSNCDKLHRRFYRYGVAKSRKAANRQKQTGHYRPRVNRGVYLANDHLDADNDRTACEVAR
jgi:hypothetical protein